MSGKKGWSVLGCVVIFALLVGAGMMWYLGSRPAKLDFNVVGGTILIYEVDRRQDRGMPDNLGLLVEALQKRLDSLNYGLVTVRAEGKDRVELLVARRAGHVKDVQGVKDLAAKMGILEFRIVANRKDDSQGQKAASAAVRAAADQLKARALAGVPPLGPTKLDDPTHTELAHFTLALPSRQKSVVTYSWVELGPQERRALNLDIAARTDPARANQYKGVKYDSTFHVDDPSGRPMLSGALFFARKCEDRNLSDEERRVKGDELFVLTRDPEFDPAEHKPGDDHENADQVKCEVRHHALRCRPRCRRARRGALA